MPAVPEPLDRHARLRRRRRALRERAATARASPSSTTARTAIPLRTRAATRRGGVGGTRRRRPPRAARCAARTSARSRDPVGYNGTMLRVDPATGAALPDNPLVGGADANDDRDRRLRAPQPVPRSRRARARARSGSATSAGTPGRRSTASRHRRRVGRELRLALLRGRRPPAGLRRHRLDICQTLYDAPDAVTAPFFTYNHGDQVVAGRRLRDRQLVDLRPRLLRRRQLSGDATTARSSSPTTAGTASG